MLRAVSAVLIVCEDNSFGVAVSVKGVAELFQLRAQLEIVVDFAIEDDPRRAICVVNRLLSALEVNDGEPPHRQPDPVLKIKTVFVRPAMAYCLAHARKQATI